MYIDYWISDGIEYAKVVHSVRKGKKVVPENTIYLGRVIDKQRKIFKNRERGMFVYDVETNTFSKVPSEWMVSTPKRKTKVPSRQILSVVFGDIFLLDSYLKSIDFYKVVDAIQFRNPDTIRALLCFYILTDMSNRFAREWWESSYAKYLFPRAQMDSQRISEALEDIGSEEAKRNFFREYIPFIENMDLVPIEHRIEDAILIDSTGLPNDVQLPITAVSNHNGVVSNEIRMIYAIRQKTGLPLFYRYIAGNVVDVSTLTRTIAELKANNIATRFVILDAGYYTGTNADELYKEKVDFLCRMKGNYTLYKDILTEHLEHLENRSNFVSYNGRVFYIKHIVCKIGSKNNLPAHAYLCRDNFENVYLSHLLLEKAKDQELSDDELYDEMSDLGVFVLISSKYIDKKELLPLYYTRDQVEKGFNITKQLGKILPLNIEKESTLRGHLLIAFMASVIAKLMQGKLKGTGLTVKGMLFSLRIHHALVYDKELITNEVRKQCNIAYKAFDIKCPVKVPIESMESK